MRYLIAAAMMALAIAGVRADQNARIAAIAAKAPATIGVAALDVETGRRAALRADERFPMGSVFKFPVALAFLERVDSGQFSLDASVTIQPNEFSVGFSPIRDNAKGKPVTMTYAAILAAMLRDSDNTAADFLLPRLGGPRGVTDRLRALGVTGIRVDRSEREIGADLAKPGGVAKYAADPRDTASPQEAIELLRRFHHGEDGLSPASHALAVKLMTETTTGANRIKALLPPGTVVAHKTGTMPGTANDIGVVTSADGKRHVLIAVFTKAATTDNLDVRERAIAEISKAICDELWGDGRTRVSNLVARGL
jgi:beta-lactamase class A